MSSLNRSIPRSKVLNHNGLLVNEANAKNKLVRMTLANMLWENQAYMDGQSNVGMLQQLVTQVDPGFVANLALVAREKFKLRHVPLALMRELARAGKMRAEDLAKVIQRPDEMSEFLALYWKDGKVPISNQVKKGLAAAFGKFNEYSLAKWDKPSAAIRLRDVMFLCHPKPANLAQEILFDAVANQTLQTPDTWETELSGGADKRITFMRLMAEKKLGALAFLRNLRNMVQAGVPNSALITHGMSVDVSKVLPFRYLAAARIVPQLSPLLERMMLKSLASHAKLPGKTKLYVDVSGSMFQHKVSEKSDLLRFDAAAALAMLCAEVCEEVKIYSFSNEVVRIPSNIKGFALADALKNSQRNAGTWVGKALRESASPADRVIVFTDEESHDTPPNPAFGAKGYMVNVASYENGINQAAWLTISGFSEAVIDFIQAVEKEDHLL